MKINVKMSEAPNEIRHNAYEAAEKLNEVGLAGDAYRLMTQACLIAWGIDKEIQAKERGVPVESI